MSSLFSDWKTSHVPAFHRQICSPHKAVKLRFMIPRESVATLHLLLSALFPRNQHSAKGRGSRPREDLSRPAVHLVSSFQSRSLCYGWRARGAFINSPGGVGILQTKRPLPARAIKYIVFAAAGYICVSARRFQNFGGQATCIANINIMRRSCDKEQLIEPSIVSIRSIDRDVCIVYVAV